MNIKILFSLNGINDLLFNTTLFKILNSILLHLGLLVLKSVTKNEHPLTNKNFTPKSELDPAFCMYKGGNLKAFK